MTESIRPQEDDGSIAAGSEVMFDLVCYPCDKSDEIKEADGYCTDCREHMCATCLKYHTNMSLTKHHVLVDKENMPGTQGPSIYSDVCTQRCQIHRDKVKEYYCSSHKELGCGICMVKVHDTCKGKLHIPDEAKHLDNSKEFKDFQAKMESLIKKSDTMINSSESSVKYAVDCLHKALFDIETFRQEINNILDELKISLEEQAEEIVAENKATMTAVADEANRIKAELKHMASEIKTMLSKKQHCQMFINMKRSETKLADIDMQLEKEKSDRLTGFRFKPSEDLQKLVRRKDALGELLVKNQKKMKATHVADINVKSRGDAKTYMYTIHRATLLSKETLVVADCDNAIVKLIDTERKHIVSEYKPENAPCDVTTINRKQVAVTVPDAKKIVFIRAEDILTFEREILVNQHCGFIACTEDKLIVSFRSDPPSVGILSMTGETLQTFSTSSQGQPLFSCAACVTVSPFSRAIYASDFGDNNRVLMLDMDGNVMAVYKDDDLKTPVNMAVDNLGMLYVCGANSNNIHMLTPDCEKVKVLLTEKDGMKWPTSVCYCRDTGRLYVGMKKKDTIKVFQLT